MIQKFGMMTRFATLLAVLFVAFSCSKKLNPLPSSLFTASPSPLELVGTKVPVTVNGKFPEKWFHKNAIVNITPILKYAGGEAVGTTYTFQGEKVSGNNVVIPNSGGGVFVVKSTFDYVPAMNKSELYLRIEASIKGKKMVMPDVKVADGVNATVALATATASTPATAPDQFQRVVKEKYDANIKFLIQQAELRKSELTSTNLAAWKSLVESAVRDSKKDVNVEISAYASPDGGYELNEKLAGKREQNTKAHLSKDFAKRNIAPNIVANYTAQDWEGFQELVKASNIQDKDLILRVLSMYPDAETREREIKNISVVFKELAETILPQLRRSRLTAYVDVIGKTDEEMATLWASNKNELGLEELLYFATLPNANEQAIYAFAAEKYPNDARAWNNLANTYFRKGDVAKATQYYNKAAGLNGNDASVNANLGLLALNEGNLDKAQQYLGKAAGASTVNEALGLLYLQQGKYAKAVEAFGNAKTNNAAVANLLVKNYDKAQSILDAVPNKDANTAYIAAVVAARANNLAGVTKNLKEAVRLDAKMADRAKADLEFAKILAGAGVIPSGK